MRSFLELSFKWAPVLLIPCVANILAMSATMPVTKTSVQQYDLDHAFGRFYLSGAPRDILVNPLVVELQIPPTTDVLSRQVIINGQTLDLNWNWKSPDISPEDESGSSSQTRPLPEYPAVVAYSAWRDYRVNIPGYGGGNYDTVISIAINALQDYASTTLVDNISEAYIFKIKSLNEQSTSFGFSALVHPRSSHRLRSIIPSTSGGRAGEFEQRPLPRSFVVEPRWDRAARREPIDFNVTTLTHTDHIPDGPVKQEISVDIETSPSPDRSFHIEAEIASLLALEAQAGEIQTRLNAKRLLIADHLKQHRDNASLRHLLQQCDGVVCAAKMVAQRICDKMGINTQPSFKYVEVQSPLTQHLLGLTKEESETAAPKLANSAVNALDLDELADAGLGLHIDFSSPTDALIKILEIIATALGLVALCTWIHRKFMPMRTRVERDADREERRNARAYRRAARRAQLRARWADFTRSINCFRSSGPSDSPSYPPRRPFSFHRDSTPRNGDYEEKRALILQDALLEQDINQAEKGEIMEAEIRQLRHAHALVSSMIRGGGSENVVYPAPIADPPPPLVPLPYTPLTRSRASSGTLPSYTSEMLPEYRSRLASSDGASSSRRGARAGSHSEDDDDEDDDDDSSGLPSSSSAGSDDGSGPPAGSGSSDSSRLQSTAPSEVGSGRSRFTVLSSILDIDRSPRISEETLRTRQSKETRYSLEF